LILARLARIPDPRRQASVEPDLTTLLLSGILLFAYQYASRRQGNRELSRPEFLASLRTRAHNRPCATDARTRILAVGAPSGNGLPWPGGRVNPARGSGTGDRPAWATDPGRVGHPVGAVKEVVSVSPQERVTASGIAA